MCLTAIIGATLVGGLTSLATGAMQANAAEKAATTQAQAAENSLALQTRQYEEGVRRNQPFIDAGVRANEAYQNELGLGAEAKAGTFQSGFKETPGYAFQVAEGEKGAVNNLAALGMKNSGAALKALTRFRTGLADQTYNNYLDRLSGASVGGQTVVGNQNALGAAYANNAGQTMQDKGAATASGYVGGANAWGNALTNIGNQAGWALGMGTNGFGGFGNNGAQLKLGYQQGVFK